MLTLALTTSTSVMGVAVCRHGEVLTERVEATERRHAERLLPLAVEALDDAGVALRSVQRLAVDVGPGLFTGLRVGLATVGGLSRALDAPVVTASSLFLVAAGAGRAGEVLAVIDARRGEVFCQRFRVDGDAVRSLGPPSLLDPTGATAAHPLLSRGPVADGAGPLAAVGDGAVRYRDLFESAGCEVVPGAPSVRELARRADDLEASPTRIPSPLYLRDPDARIGAWTTRADTPTDAPIGTP